jgi:hypothetical protein
MAFIPSREARLAHARKHCELWNAKKREEWIASWRTIAQGAVRMYDPVGTEEKVGFETATGDAYDMFRPYLEMHMLTVHVNGHEMAWVIENHFKTAETVSKSHSIETFRWNQDGDLLIKTYYSMPENIGPNDDPYAFLLGDKP